jgi:hypothetical protein
MAPFVNGTKNIKRVKFPGNGGGGSGDTDLNAILEIEIKLQEGTINGGNSPSFDDDEGGGTPQLNEDGLR